MTWAKVGMKVVCIDGSQMPMLSSKGNWRRPEYWGIRLPEKGEIYTVSGFCSEGGLYLAEIDSGVISCTGEMVSYKPVRFRPVVSKEDDIAVFKRIADQVPNMEMQDE